MPLRNLLPTQILNWRIKCLFTTKIFSDLINNFLHVFRISIDKTRSNFFEKQSILSITPFIKSNKTRFK